MDSFTELVDGTYAAGRSLVVWARAPGRLGVVHAGPLKPADLDLTLDATARDVLHDLGAIELVDQTAFACIEAHVARWTGARRVAMVRPPGLAGAVIGGLFHDRIAPHVDARLCLERAEAYAWLGIDELARTALDEISELPPELLRRVGEEIAGKLSTATLESVADTLALTPRTLQRKLALHGTTFRDEVMRVRLHAAESMLLERDDKVEVIAREIGFSSMAAFSAMFHRVAGESPSSYRLRRRAG